jgi:1,4-dihydroxy-6-naphthoate synthase
MERVLSLGYSPCPNDTFIFYGLAERRIDVRPYRFDITLSDVEELNRKAALRVLDITKVSIHAVLHLLDNYWLLKAGGAIGRGCGPLVVAREKTTMEELRFKSIAIPGKMTTANLLLQVNGIHEGPCVEMMFDRIMPAVAGGEVDAGVIIHEGRFTYPAYGLQLVLDLGEWWEAETRMPIPLGGILMKRELGADAARFIEGKIRESLLYAKNHTEEAWPYIRAHAREMEPAVIGRHIEMFVNDFSLDVGSDGESSIRHILEAASSRTGVPLPDKPIFRE